MKKPILNKWQTTISLQRDYRTMDRGWKIFEFGIFNLKEIPPQGEMLRSKYYKGFLIRFAIWLPFDMV